MAKQERSCLEIEGVFGQEFEPRYHDAANRADYAAGDLRCILHDGEDYRVSVGVGGSYVAWQGYNGQGGDYDGKLYLVGPSAKVVSHNGGWDAAVRLPAFGKLKSDYTEGAYASHRENEIRGLTATVNNFARKLRGEQYFYETSVSWAWAKPFGDSDLRQTYFGQTLADKGEPTRYYTNVSVRNYIMRLGETKELYGQLGLNVEKPFSRSANARVGVAFFDRCLNVGAGADHDLIKHATVPAAGYGVDPLACGDAYRVHVRGAQIVREAKAQGINFAPDSIGPAPPQ